MARGDVISFDDFDAEETRPHVNLQSELFQPAVNVKPGGRRSYQSYVTLAPFFGAADGSSFGATVAGLVGRDFAITYSAVAKLKLSGEHTVQFNTVKKIIDTERKLTSSTVARVDYSGSTQWNVAQWIAHFLYTARLALFDLSNPSSFARAGIPESLHDDRAYAVWTLLFAYRRAKDKAVEKKSSATTTKGSSTSKAPAAATPTTPAQFEFEDGLLATLAVDRVLGDIERQVQPAVKPSRSKKQHLADVDVDALVGSSRGPPLRDFTLADYDLSEIAKNSGLRQLFPSIAAMSKAPCGDDTSLNDMHTHFYTVRGDPKLGARLIGSDHLAGIDPTRPVDFIDDWRLDRTNCSSTMLANFIRCLRDTDPAEADSIVAELERQAKAGDPFAARHMKAVQPTQDPKDARDHALKDMFTDDAFAEARFALIARVTEFETRKSELSRMLENGILDEDHTAGVVDANTHDGHTMAVGDATAEVPTREGIVVDNSETKRLVQIDTDDPVWRRRQQELLGAFASAVTSAAEYETALSRLHVQKRSQPLIPGQAEPPLLWSQTTNIWHGVRLAIHRYNTGSGRRGILDASSTGLGKTNVGLGIMLGVSRYPVHCSGYF
jgi:hypothetical protein